MDEPSIWVAVVGGLGMLATGAFSYRARRQETTVAREAGYVGAYDRLVGNLEREIARVYVVVAELRADNDRLYAELREVRSKLDAALHPPGGPT